MGGGTGGGMGRLSGVRGGYKVEIRGGTGGLQRGVRGGEGTGGGYGGGGTEGRLRADYPLSPFYRTPENAGVT